MAITTSISPPSISYKRYSCAGGSLAECQVCHKKLNGGDYYNITLDPYHYLGYTCVSEACLNMFILRFS